MNQRASLVLFGLLTTAACSRDAAAPQVAAAEAASPAITGENTILEQHPEKAPNFSSINISDRIRTQCGIDEAGAYFDFDSANVTPEADRLLGLVATCFTTGPLAGTRLSLVGHADPRGDEAYNMVLGGQRAERTSAALAAKGMPADQISATSRGQLDATGEDEAGWAKDRRVDVTLTD